ncbi:hypothetical protein [Rhizomonospora bruguierae]|uniref:hypothetical protein n=1 Tax=Rhizomonospora bruguierae TaxID=1581705 RepID=UPI001BCEC5F5|nr:hypothetical protein [Micromonospora sp. NBRC 107566]
MTAVTAQPPPTPADAPAEPGWRARLRGGGAALFPTAEPAARPGWRAIALALAAAAAGTAISLARQPGAGALDTVWAEDGQVFLGQAVDNGPLPALGTSYAGYYHVVPRLVAGLASLAPAGAAAAVLAVTAALLVAATAVLVHTASGAHLRSPLARTLAAAVVVVVPLAQDELPNSIANLHWYGLYALFWMLVWTPRGRAGRVLAGAVVLAVAASDILTLVFVPLALARVLRRTPQGRRDRYGSTLAGLLGAGLALQVAGLASGSSSRQLTPDPVLAASGFVLRAVPGALIGERWLGTGVDARWLALAGLAWLLVAGAVLAAVLRLTRPHGVLAAVAGLHAAALYALPVLLSGTATFRYAAAPAMLVVTALAALLRPGTGTRGRLPLYALAALLALVCAVNLRVDNPRAHGPRWSTELDRARVACANGAERVALPIPPAGEDAWRANLPCDYVTG